jgi:hypothetical protein
VNGNAAGVNIDNMKPGRSSKTLWTAGCVRFALGASALLVIVTAVAAVMAVSRFRSGIATNEAAAAHAVRAIAEAQRSFLFGGFMDHNGDGIGDYGTLRQLADPAGDGSRTPLIDPLLATRSRYGYRFRIEVIYGDGVTLPNYRCVALPRGPEVSGARRFYVDGSDIVRCVADGSDVNENSPPFTGESP